MLVIKVHNVYARDKSVFDMW